jgi:multiple sugar transport system permease protein
MSHRIIKTKTIASRIAEYLFLIFFAVLNMIPVVWGVVTSIKNIREINTIPPKIIGFQPTLTHYITVLKGPFLQSIANSLFYAALAILMGVVFGYLAGYGFARRNFPLKRVLFFIVVVGIPLSGGSSVLLIPNYLYLLTMNMTNRWYTLPLIYAAYNLPMAIWIFIAGVKAVPIELEEAARIDGVNQAYIITRLIPPLVKPSIAAAALFVFIGSWNDYITASVMVSGNLKAIQQSIYEYMGYFGIEWGRLTASATLAILPILIAFTFAGRQLVSGLTAGAVKG